MTCRPCEYDDPERSPATVEGWACWSAAQAAIRGGMVDVHVDATAALSLAEASGVARVHAAELIVAADEGMRLGRARKEGKA